MKSFTFTHTLTSESGKGKDIVPSWIFASLFIVIFLISYVFYNKINYLALIFIISLGIGVFYKPSDSKHTKPFGSSTLEFGINNLLYKSGDSIIWHIPYERLEKIQVNWHGSGGIFSPIRKEILIITNDNDSYSVVGTVPDQEIEEIQQEIEIAKSNVI